MIAQGHIVDAIEREASPFAAVIAEYKRHADKTRARVSRRSGVTENELRTVTYCLWAAALLEIL